MGLLDEAIREHLDLKRRRGADPTEVERAELEALGPVRRNTATAEAGDDPVGVAYDDEAAEIGYEDEAVPGAAYDQAADDGWGDDDVDAHVRPAGPESPSPFTGGPGEPAPDPSPGRAKRGLSRLRGRAPASDPDAGDEPFAAEPPRRSASGETTEYDVEDALAAGDHQEGEDVLEETPEFLQDTPDHDRLWFEQRPPRDFDFDG